MLSTSLHGGGVRAWQMQFASMGAVGLWIRAKTVDQDERVNAGRRALSVGPSPTIWLIGDSLARQE
jgi:hypothetical protein